MPAGPAIKISVRVAQVSVAAAGQAGTVQPSATHVGFTLMLGLHCWDRATLTLERAASCTRHATAGHPAHAIHDCRVGPSLARPSSTHPLPTLYTEQRSSTWHCNSQLTARRSATVSRASILISPSFSAVAGKDAEHQSASLRQPAVPMQVRKQRGGMTERESLTQRRLNVTGALAHLQPAVPFPGSQLGGRGWVQRNVHGAAA